MFTEKQSSERKEASVDKKPLVLEKNVVHIIESK